MLTKKSILQKTMQVSSFTMLSRLLGLVREALMVRYLGAGILSDAFFTAYKIPNSLRKIFAEGALSASFIPTFVGLVKGEKRSELNSLMTASFLIIEGVLVAICVLFFAKAEWVIRIIAPGWYAHDVISSVAYTGISVIDMVLNSAVNVFGSWGDALPQAVYAVTYLRILIAFILFLSCGSLLAGALQSTGHFFVPAFAPVLLNIVFILGLVVCSIAGLPVQYLCFFILFGGLVQFLLHVYVYFKLYFSFGRIDRTAWHNFGKVMAKFLPCIISMSVMEIQLFIGTSLASFLPQGAVSLIYYANRFMGIPLGVFATAFSTILLPHFSRISIQNPKRLPFYLLEASKFIFWVTLPSTVVMSFFAKTFFLTIFLSKKFTVVHATAAGYILIAFLLGLFFFSMNKILLNVYYALHDTRTPLLISCIVTVLYFFLSYFWMMPSFGMYGLAFGMTCSGILQTFFFSFLLWYRFGMRMYVLKFCQFAIRYVLQVLVVTMGFFGLYYACIALLQFASDHLRIFLSAEIGIWLWVVPLIILYAYVLLKTRKLCGVRLYFLD